MLKNKQFIQYERTERGPLTSRDQQPAAMTMLNKP